MNDEEIIKAVRWRFRICNYLFTVGAAWIVLGIVLGQILLFVLHSPDVYALCAVLAVGITGAGIFSAAFALTLAIYRCPVCDRFLSRFRPRKDQCGHCGAKVR